MSIHLPLGLTAGGVGIWVLVFAFFGTLIKVWPAIKRLQNESDVSLRGTLTARIDKLEKQAEINNTEMRIVTHALNNERSGVDTLLHWLETGKTIPPATLKRIVAQRAAHADRFDAQMAEVTAARLAVAEYKGE